MEHDDVMSDTDTFNETFLFYDPWPKLKIKQRKKGVELGVPSRKQSDLIQKLSSEGDNGNKVELWIYLYIPFLLWGF